MPDLSPKEMDALQDFLNGLVPNLSLSLAEQINREVVLEILTIQSVPLQVLLSRGENVLETVFSLNQLATVESAFLISEETGLVLLDVLEGNEGTDPPTLLSEAQLERLSNAMHGVIRGLAMALTNITGENVEVESCTSNMGSLILPPVFALDGNAIQVQMMLSVPGLVDTEATLLFTPESAKNFLPDTSDSSSGSGSILTEDELAAMLGEIGAPGGTGMGMGMPPEVNFGGGMDLPPGTGASPFTSFPPPQSAPTGGGIELILDIPLEVTVELGRVRMLIKDVLELSSGSIVELDRVAGEPVDLLVNGRLIAKGEVVVIEDNFGIRITEIISPADRVAGLGKGR